MIDAIATTTASTTPSWAAGLLAKVGPVIGVLFVFYFIFFILLSPSAPKKK